MSDSTKTRLKILIMVYFLVGFALAGCQNQATMVALDTSPVIAPSINLPGAIERYPELDRHPDIEAAYNSVAENDILRLYVNPDNSAIIVEDLRSGTLWRSSPEDLYNHEGTTNIWRSLIEMPIQISYVDAARAQQKNIKPTEVTLSYQPLKGGVRVTYDIESFDLALDVAYVLKEDCLEATILSDSIIEDGENTLVSIDLLAFLGATHDGEEGYMVYPDGSGALIYFNTPHPPEVQKMMTTVFGIDDVSDQSSIFREQMVIPLFGIVHGKSAMIGMITQGEFDAEMGIARSGKGVNYNHVWAQFLYRRQGRFSLTGGQPAFLYQPDRIPGDRQVRYCFTNGDKASYVEMASRYRQFLVDERGANRVEERLGNDLPWLNLIFFMGIERRTWFLADMITMTTFEEVRDIMTELHAMGVKNADVTLWYWNEGGTKGEYPRRLPVDERLGGEQALVGLIEQLHQLGYKIYLQDNYLHVFPGSKDVQPFLDAVRGVDGLPAGDPEMGYLLNPQVALREFALPNLPTIASYGADGLFLESFGYLVLPDKNSRYPLSRENFAATWMEIAQAYRDELGFVAMEGGNVYAVPYADRLDFVPLDSTHYDFFDETIPLYHIAVHGLVPYTNIPYNFLSDNQRMFLRQVEYGAIPIFILSKESSSLLFRTNANSVYSSRYEYWRDEILKQYQEIENLTPIMSRFITGHARLSKGVYSTTYEDGIKVIVNYNSEPYSTDQFSVPPQDYIIVGGN